MLGELLRVDEPLDRLGALRVDGALWRLGALRVDGAGALWRLGALRVDGTLCRLGALRVDGALCLLGALRVEGTPDRLGALRVVGALGLSGALRADGAFCRFGATRVEGAALLGALRVDGALGRPTASDGREGRLGAALALGERLPLGDRTAPLGAPRVDGVLGLTAEGPLLEVPRSPGVRAAAGRSEPDSRSDGRAVGLAVVAGVPPRVAEGRAGAALRDPSEGRADAVAALPVEGRVEGDAVGVLADGGVLDMAGLAVGRPPALSASATRAAVGVGVAAPGRLVAVLDVADRPGLSL